jgi:hypothetical protein
VKFVQLVCFEVERLRYSQSAHLGKFDFNNCRVEFALDFDNLWPFPLRMPIYTGLF